MKKLILFLLCIPGLHVYAQHVLMPQQVYLSNTRGDNHVDVVHEDKRGFIWASTPEGLIRYDGAVAKKYPFISNTGTEITGFLTNSICEDAEGTIWCLSNDIGLLYLKRGPMGYDTLRRYKTDFSPQNRIRTDKKGNLWSTEALNLFYINPKSGQKIIYEKTARIKVQFFDLDESGSLWVCGSDGVYHINNIWDTTVRLKKVVEKERFLDVQISGEEVYLFMRDKILRIKINPEGQYSIRDITRTQHQHTAPAYFFMRTMGVSTASKFIALHGEQNPIILLDKESGEMIVPEVRGVNLAKMDIFRYFISRSGILYMATNKGLLRANMGNDGFTTYYSGEHEAFHMRFRCVFSPHKDTIFLGTAGSGFFIYTRREGRFFLYRHITIDQHYIQYRDNIINSMYRDKLGRTWIGTNSGLFRYDESKQSCTMTLDSLSAFSLTEDDKGGIWIGTNAGGIQHYDPFTDRSIRYTYQEISPHDLGYRRVWSVQYHKGYVYAGTGCGLLQLNIKTEKVTEIFPKLHYANVWHVSVRDSLWRFCTQGRGIWEYYPSKGTLQKVPSREKIFFYEADDSRGNSWIINDQGIMRYDGQHFRKYEITEGMHSNMLSYMGVTRLSDHEMVVCGEDGFTVIDINKLKPVANNPEPLFTQLAYGGREIGDLLFSGDQVKLDYEKGLLLMRWAITATEEKNYCVQYMLEGVDTGWREAGGHDAASYLDIPPGRYTMLLQLTDETGSEVYKYSELLLTIVPPFWMTLWFKVIVALVLLGTFIYLLYNWFSRQRLSQEKLKSNMEALRSQMNPHFVFNALNSVQSFIYSEEKETANEYLAKFSRLMRMILEYSREEFILLSLEKKFLELYLELEAHRFSHLTFEVQCNEQDEFKCKIPPLLIQPLVENAVKHGVKTADQPLHILVRFQLRKNVLEVEIMDNGIGLQHEENEKRHTKSLGTTLIEERLALLTRTYKKKFTLLLRDRKAMDEATHGTYVKLNLPQ